MVAYYVENIINLLIFLMPVLFGLKRYTVLDKASRIFLLYAISSFVGELIAFYAAVRYKNNLAVYNVASLVNITAICFYFNECIERLRLRKAGYILLICHILAWLVSVFVVHSFYSINSTFLAYQGLIVIALSVYAMENLVTQKSQHIFSLRASPHFWFACLLLVYWCLTIMQWVVYPFFTRQTSGFRYLDFSLSIINMMVYASFALVFFYFPKLKQPDDI